MHQSTLFRGRRDLLFDRLPGRAILLMGHRPVPRNYPANPYPFRQDSTFLYFTGCAVPGAAALLDAEGRHATLFLPSPDPGDELWHGSVPGAVEIGAAAGADEVAPRDRLAERARALAARRGGTLLGLPVCEAISQAELAALVGGGVEPGAVDGPSAELADAVIALRNVKDGGEVAEIVATAEVTARAHRAAMAATRPGVREREIAALMDAVFAAAGCAPAYGSIVTVRGEILHGVPGAARLESDRLLLVDAGAESASGYATDVTRTWPVSGRFGHRQRAVYEVVLRAQAAAIARCRPGTRYRDVHLAAATVIAEGLVDLGLLRGDPDRAVEDGAHAMFFPHGVGHLLGLDVHDMEGYGDRAGYPPGRARSPQFGLSYLRLDRDLEPGSCVTVEPGIYFVPALLQSAELRGRFRDRVDFAAAEAWLGFGGIRIEDDVVVTAGDPKVPTAGIPKEIAEIEALVGSGPDPGSRLSG